MESCSVTKHMMLFFALSTTLLRMELACTIELVGDGKLLYLLEITNSYFLPKIKAYLVNMTQCGIVL